MRTSTYIWTLVCLLLCITTTSAVVVTTNSSSGVDTNSATLIGNLTNFTGSTAQVWFVYDMFSHPQPHATWGLNENLSAYSFKSDNQSKTTNGTFTVNLEGIKDGMFAEKTYYFRACANDSTNYSCGNELNFTLTAVSLTTTQNFGKYYDELIESRFNLTLMAALIPKPYTNIMTGESGQYIFWGLIFSVIFLCFWIRSEDVTIPAITGLILASILVAFLPPGWKKLAESLLVVSIFAVIYSIIHGRR